MELNELQNSWKGIKTPRLTDQQIYTMIKQNDHPSLQKGQKQVLIESACFIIFLFLYYTMLDGNKKPFYINAILVGTVMLNIIQQLSVFALNKNIGAADNIRNTLKGYSGKLSRYYIFTIVTRLGLMAGIIIFSTYNIVWDTNKIILLALLMAVFSIQLFFFHKLWKSRIDKVREDVLYFID